MVSDGNFIPPDPVLIVTDDAPVVLPITIGCAIAFPPILTPLVPASIATYVFEVPFPINICFATDLPIAISPVPELIVTDVDPRILPIVTGIALAPGAIFIAPPLVFILNVPLLVLRVNVPVPPICIVPVPPDPPLRPKVDPDTPLPIEIEVAFAPPTFPIETNDVPLAL